MVENLADAEEAAADAEEAVENIDQPFVDQPFVDQPFVDHFVIVFVMVENELSVQLEQLV